MSSLHPEVDQYADTLRHSVDEGKIPERILESKVEIDRLIRIAQIDNAFPLHVERKSLRVIQLCAGFGASSLALLEAGFDPENIENVDANAATEIQHKKNPELAKMSFSVSTVQDYLATKDTNTFHPDLFVGTWSSWLVIVDVLNFKLAHPSNKTTGLFTLCQLRPGVDDAVRVDDAAKLKEWIAQNTGRLDQNGIVVDMQQVSENMFAEIHDVVVYSKTTPKRT